VAQKLKFNELLKAMHLRYGKKEGEKCKNCIYFVTKRYSKAYHKCRLTVQTNSPRTDWRAGYDACGKHNADWGECPACQGRGYEYNRREIMQDIGLLSVSTHTYDCSKCNGTGRIENAIK